MSQSALSNIEREKRSARPATIHRIAKALRVPVAAITREYDETADHPQDTARVSDLTLRRPRPDIAHVRRSAWEPGGERQR